MTSPCMFVVNQIFPSGPAATLRGCESIANSVMIPARGAGNSRPALPRPLLPASLITNVRLGGIYGATVAVTGSLTQFGVAPVAGGHFPANTLALKVSLP